MREYGKLVKWRGTHGFIRAGDGTLYVAPEEFQKIGAKPTIGDRFTFRVDRTERGAQAVQLIPKRRTPSSAESAARTLRHLLAETDNTWDEDGAPSEFSDALDVLCNAAGIRPIRLDPTVAREPPLEPQPTSAEPAA